MTNMTTALLTPIRMMTISTKHHKSTIPIPIRTRALMLNKTTFLHLTKILTTTTTNQLCTRKVTNTERPIDQLFITKSPAAVATDTAQRYRRTTSHLQDPAAGLTHMDPSIEARTRLQDVIMSTTSLHLTSLHIKKPAQ